MTCIKVSCTDSKSTIMITWSVSKAHGLLARPSYHTFQKYLFNVSASPSPSVFCGITGGSTEIATWLLLTVWLLSKSKKKNIEIST